MRTPFLVLGVSYSRITFNFSGFIRNPMPALIINLKYFIYLFFKLVFIYI